RHLNEQRQAATEWISLFHQTQLLYLQLAQAGIVLLHPLHFFLHFFHPRRMELRLLHGLRRTPFEREEERINDDRKDDDSDAVATRPLIEMLDRPEDRHSQRACDKAEPAVVD